MTRMERTGNLVLIRPWDPRLSSVLSYTRVEQGGPFSRTVTRIKEPMFHRSGDAAYFPAGLFEDVLKWFDAHQMKYEVVDRRNMKALMPEPDWSAVGDLRTGQDVVLKNITTAERGRIVCNTGFGKTYLIRQICKMYPTLKIIVATPGRDDAMALYHRIRAEHPAHTVALMGAGSHGDADSRISVCVTKSLLKADLEGCDLFLFDEVHVCGHNEVAADLLKVTKARMFGFSASPTGRSDAADPVSKAIFGNILCEYRYEDSVKAGLVVPIEVRMYTIVSDVRIGFNTPKIIQKRMGYWTNRLRNMNIAYLAVSVPDDEQTLIMVETLEHMVALHQFLPDDFVLIYGAGSRDDYDAYAAEGLIRQPKLTPKMRDAYRLDFERGKVLKAVSTMVWKQAVL